MISTPILLRVTHVCLTGQVEPHRRVLSIHGPVGHGEWHHTREEAVNYIENWKFSYYLLNEGRAVRVVVGLTAAGEKFLKAEPDGDTPELLLHLPSILPTVNPATPPMNK